MTKSEIYTTIAAISDYTEFTDEQIALYEELDAGGATMNTQWTDERIASELASIAKEHFDDLVVLRMAQTIVPLMRRMRDELTTTINAERTATMTMKAAWIDAAGDYGTLLQKYDALLAYTRRLYAGAVEHGLSICLEAPEDVQAATTARTTTTLRTERIECPSCGTVQDAAVTHTAGDPWPSFTHFCERCGYVIMESEWQKADS